MFSFWKKKNDKQISVSDFNGTEFAGLTEKNISRIDLKFGPGNLTLFVVVPTNVPENFGAAKDWSNFIRISILKNIQYTIAKNQIEFEKSNDSFNQMLQAQYKDVIPVH